MGFLSYSFLQLVSLSVTAALFVLLLFCIGFDRIVGFKDILKTAGAGVYVAVLLQLTGVFGNGWVFAVGIILPLVLVFFYGLWTVTQKR